MNNEDLQLDKKVVEEIIEITLGYVSFLRTMVSYLQNEKTSMFERYMTCVRLMTMHKFLENFIIIQKDTFKYGYLINSELLRKNGGIENDWDINKEDLSECPLFTEKNTIDERVPSLIDKLIKH